MKQTRNKNLAPQIYNYDLEALEPREIQRFKEGDTVKFKIPIATNRYKITDKNFTYHYGTIHKVAFSTPNARVQYCIKIIDTKTGKFSGKKRWILQKEVEEMDLKTLIRGVIAENRKE